MVVRKRPRFSFYDSRYIYPHEALIFSFDFIMNYNTILVTPSG